MTHCEEFLDHVLAPAGPHQQQQALIAYLNSGFEAAEALHSAAARPQAHMQHIVQAKDCIAALATPQALARIRERTALAGATAGGGAAEPDELAPLRHQLQLVQSGGEHFLWLLGQVRMHYQHRVARRDYSDGQCGAYPLRDALHDELPVARVDPLSEPALSGRQYGYAGVEPFADPKASADNRARRYLDQLLVRTLTAEDLRSAAEHTLIGQRGLFARKGLPAGTCVGLYGGQVMDPLDIFLLQDDRYLIGASRVPGELAINGETMLAMANTLLLYDNGKPTGHPPGGYNMEGAAFRVRLADGRDLLLRAFFTTEDVAPGEELRWNYQMGRHVSG